MGPRGEDQADPVSRIAENWEYATQVWLELGNRWYQRARERSTWRTSDIVGDCTDLMEHLTPVVERSIDVTLEAMRPYAAAFRVRSDG